MSSFRTNVTLSVAALLAVSAYGMPAVFAQTTTAPAPTGDSSPLKFTLREGGDNSTSTASQNTTASATNATKDLTINVSVMKGDKPISLPINATIPEGMQDLQLCVSAMNGTEMCQPVLLVIDLTKNDTATSSNGSMPVPMAAVVPAIANGGYAVTQVSTGSLINIEDTTVTIPVTVIVPLTLQIQNAQVCASVLSSGETTCTQVVVNPTQTAYTPVDVDLTSPTPVVTSAEDTTTQSAPSTTSEPSSNTTGTGSGTTNSDTGSGSDNTTGGNTTTT